MAQVLGVEYLSPVIGGDEEIWLLIRNPDYPVAFEYEGEPEEFIQAMLVKRTGEPQTILTTIEGDN